jgi:hypothetical protein
VDDDRELVIGGQVRCHARTTRELVEERRRAEFDEDFVSPVIALSGFDRRGDPSSLAGGCRQSQALSCGCAGGAYESASASAGGTGS